MSAEVIARQFELCGHVLKRNLEGLTHEESVQQPAQGNNVNWVVGHIVRARNNMLGLLTGEPLFDRKQFDAYEVEPLTDRSKAIRFDELLDKYESLQKPLTDAVRKLSPEKWAEKAPFSPTGNPDETIGSLLTAVAFHEAYHTGQTGLQRRLVGKPGVIKSPEAVRG